MWCKIVLCMHFNRALLNALTHIGHDQCNIPSNIQFRKMMEHIWCHISWLGHLCEDVIFLANIFSSSKAPLKYISMLSLGVMPYESHRYHQMQLHSFETNDSYKQPSTMITIHFFWHGIGSLKWSVWTTPRACMQTFCDTTNHDANCNTTLRLLLK
jgi:hypothetical protein